MLASRVRGIGAALVFVAATSIGCSPNGPKLYPVSGKVVLKDGTPVKRGYVLLHADASRGNNSEEVLQGTIQNGEYTIQTGPYVGAPPGAYRVSIEAAAEVDEKNPYFTRWFAHEKYIHPDTSRLTLEVTAHPPPNAYDFALDPHPPQVDPFNPKGKKK